MKLMHFNLIWGSGVLRMTMCITPGNNWTFVTSNVINEAK